MNEAGGQLWGASAARVIVGWLALAMALVLVELAATQPEIRAASALILSVAASVAPVLGVRVHRPPTARPWLVVSAAMAAFGAGNLVWLLTGDPLGGSAGNLAIINLAKLAAFALLLTAAVLSVWASAPALVRHARPLRIRLRGRLVDTCLIGVAVVLLLVQWGVIGDADGSLLSVEGFAETAVALGAAGIMVLVLVLWPPSGRAAVSGRMLFVALGLAVVGNLAVLGGAAVPDAWTLTPMLAATALVTAAALHPSMVQLAGAPAPSRVEIPWRLPDAPPTDPDVTVRIRTALLIVLVAALLVLPAVDLVGLTGPRAGSPGTLVTSLVALLVVARIAALASARDKLAARLAELSRRFEALVAHNAEATVVVDDLGIVRYASPATVDVLGRAPDPFHELRLAELAPPPPRAGVSSVSDAATRIDPGGAPVTTAAQVEHPDGTVHAIDVTTVDLRDLQSVRGVVLHLRDVTSQRELADRLRQQALTDALTGLPNRVLFADRVDQAVRRAQRSRGRLGVLVVDLDGFKTVNDAFGHVAGDELLRQVAGRLSGALRPADTSARLGGDEFAVVLDGDTDGARAVDIGQRIVRQLREPFIVSGGTARVSASVGAAVSLPADGLLDRNALVRNADIAMYAAKRAGGDRVELFSPALRALADARLDVHAALPAAIQAGELEVHYQPIVTMDHLSVTGVEALVRWRRNGRLRTPDQFLGIAEERDDLIVPLGTAVLRQSCTAVAVLGAPPAFDLHVNVSPRQLASPRFVDSVTGALDDSGLPPSSLVLEITESGAIDTRVTGEALGMLRDRGVRVAIDDFGTGYSNLQRLRDLPVDVLKLDRSLVADLAEGERAVTAARVVEAVRSVADSMAAVTLAEGVEQPAQRDRLLQLGCHLGQGWLFGHPAPDVRAAARVGGDPGGEDGRQDEPITPDRRPARSPADGAAR